MSEIKFGITKIVDIIITSHAKANFVKRKKIKNKIKIITSPYHFSRGLLRSKTKKNIINTSIVSFVFNFLKYHYSYIVTLVKLYNIANFHIHSWIRAYEGMSL